MSEYFIKGGKSYFRLSDGTVMQIKPVSPLLLTEAQKTVEKPRPPLQRVPTGDGGFIEQYNEADDDYLRAKEKYEQDVTTASLKAALRLGVKVEVDKKAVAEIRKEFKEVFDKDLDPDDTFVYIAYVLVKSEDDLNQLGAAITSRSHPTEEAVANAIEQFQGDLSRN